MERLTQMMKERLAAMGRPTGSATSSIRLSVPSTPTVAPPPSSPPAIAIAASPVLSSLTTTSSNYSNPATAMIPPPTRTPSQDMCSMAASSTPATLPTGVQQVFDEMLSQEEVSRGSVLHVTMVSRPSTCSSAAASSIDCFGASSPPRTPGGIFFRLPTPECLTAKKKIAKKSVRAFISLAVAQEASPSTRRLRTSMFPIRTKAARVECPSKRKMALTTPRSKVVQPHRRSHRRPPRRGRPPRLRVQGLGMRPWPRWRALCHAGGWELRVCVADVQTHVGVTRERRGARHYSSPTPASSATSRSSPTAIPTAAPASPTPPTPRGVPSMAMVVVSSRPGALSIPAAKVFVGMSSQQEEQSALSTMRVYQLCQYMMQSVASWLLHQGNVRFPQHQGQAFFASALYP